MHSMLFIATVIPGRHDWAAFLEHVDQRIGQTEDVDRLAENVWLVNMKTAATAFGELVHLVKQPDHRQHLAQGFVIETHLL